MSRLWLAAVALCLVACSSPDDSPGDDVPDPQSGNELYRDIESGDAMVMWIGPHPDDELYASGVLVQACLELGNSCVIVSVSEPVGVDPEARWARREQVGQLLGAEVVNGPLAPAPGYAYLQSTGDLDGAVQRDVEFYENAGVRQAAANLFAQYAPAVLITFDPGGGYYQHPDHMAIAGIALEEYGASGLEGTGWSVLNKHDLGNWPQDPSEATDHLDSLQHAPALGATYADIKLQIYDIYAAPGDGGVPLLQDMTPEQRREQAELPEYYCRMQR